MITIPIQFPFYATALIAFFKTAKAALIAFSASTATAPSPPHPPAAPASLSRLTATSLSANVTQFLDVRRGTACFISGFSYFSISAYKKENHILESNLLLSSTY
jgi:hypothetical protein